MNRGQALLASGRLIHAGGPGLDRDEGYCNTVMAEVKEHVYQPTKVSDMGFHCYFDHKKPVGKEKREKNATIAVNLEISASNVRVDYSAF